MQVDFVVVENLYVGLFLGKKMVIDFGLFRVGLEYLSMVNQIMRDVVYVIVNKYDVVFNGVGKLKDYQLKVYIDLEIILVV